MTMRDTVASRLTRRRARARAGAAALPALTAWLLVSPAAADGDAALADAAMNRDMETVRTLVREGADVNAPGAYGTPALHWVVRTEDLAAAELLLEAGADPNLRTPYDVAPLHLAVSNGDIDMVRVLLEASAKADLPDATGETPLHMAARIGTPEIVNLLLEAGAATDQREPSFDQTPLAVAAREGHVEVARLLLARGADVDAVTRRGATPEFRLPSDNAGSKGVGIIRGGWPERGMRYAVPGAKTPLLYATRSGDPDMVRLLVESGADLEKTDANGTTPLLNALINASVASATGKMGGHFATVRYLIEQGADINAADWYGETPLWAAVDVRNLDVSGPTRDNGIDRDAALDLIHVLLERGADPNARIQEYPPERRFITGLGSLAWVDFTGQTPFLRAALAGDTTVMRLLLEHGADPNIPTLEGTTPLMAAAGVNWVINQTFDEGDDALLEAVKLAHELGNDVNAVNSMGIRAIHGAANRGSNEIIEYLVANGAKLDVADNEGRTPVVWAEGVFLATHPPMRKPETIALLEAFSGGRPPP